MVTGKMLNSSGDAGSVRRGAIVQGGPARNACRTALYAVTFVMLLSALPLLGNFPKILGI